MGMCGLAGDMRNRDDSSNVGESGKLKNEVGGNGEVRRYKSKNRDAERKRRLKLNQGMLELRSLVPKITNANEQGDHHSYAVSYIQELLGYVEQLTREMQEMDVDEESNFQEAKNSQAEDMTQYNLPIIQGEVELTHVNHTKLWMKLVCRNSRGGFTNLMEAMSYLGLEPTDISLTTSGGTVLISSCLEGIYGQVLNVAELRQFLKEIADVI